MAGGSVFVWIALLSCGFRACDSRQVPQDVKTADSHTRNPQLTHIISQNLSDTDETCIGVKEQLTSLNSQFHQATLRYNQLDAEAFELRGMVRLLNLKLSTCSATASAITNSYQVQLYNKMKRLLQTYDSDKFQILNFIMLTREVNALRRKIEMPASNSTQSAIDITVLQRQLQEKIDELSVKKAQIVKTLPNAALIFQIVSLQNQIWDLEQAESRRGGEISLQPNQRMLALQGQLDRLISELRGKGDPNSALLELISVHSTITVTQRILTLYIEKSRTNAADYKRQYDQKAELLKKKIIQLSREEHNIELTREILELQSEVSRLWLLVHNAKKATDSRIKELRIILEEKNNQLGNIQKQLEDTEFAQAQLILKIISLMKQVRELRDDEQQTSTGRETTLETLLQAKEREYSNALAEINELQKTLRLKTEECSGFEERYEQVKTELDKKIAELNKAGDSKEALILSLIKLKNDLKAIEALISNTDDPDRITELKRQLEQKQEEVILKTAEIEKVFANPRIILTIIELQDDIRDLQKKAANETNGADIKGLQNRLDDLLSQIDDKDDENTKLVLTIMALQIQVEYLQKQLSERHTLQAAQVTELTTELTDKRKELQKYVSELTEKNQTNAELILRITDLQNQLRNLEKEKGDEAQTASSRLATLLNKLNQTEAQCSSYEQELQELQKTLRLKTEECSGLEERYEQVKTELDKKIAELNKDGDSKEALILSLIKLKNDLKAIEALISNTDDPDRITELKRRLEQKQEEVILKTAEIEKVFANPRIILTIIELQDDIRDLQKKAANETNGADIKGLQNRLDDLLSQIDDKDDENTKLMLTIMALQIQVEYLQKQLSERHTLQAAQVTELTTELTDKRKELQKYVSELTEKNQTNAELILRITDLQNQLRNLEKEKGDEAQTASSRLATLLNKLNQTEAQCSSYEQELQELQKTLRLKTEECSGLEERYEQVKTELDKKIAELNKAGDSKEALILSLIKLKNDLKAIEALISNTDDPDRITELKRQLEQKQEEVFLKNAEIEKVFANPRIILTIIELQDDIRDLQKKAANETNGADIKELQNRLDDLLSQIDDKDDENTKLMLTIMALQIQVEYLQKQLSERHTLQAAQVTELTTELTDKRKELQKYVSELTEKNQTNAELILRITDLQNQLRNLEKEKGDEAQTTSSTIAKLRKQLKDKEEEHSRDQAEIEALQNKLNQTEVQCSNYEQKLQDLQNDLDDKMKELESKSNSVTSLALQISTLSLQIEELKNQLENTVSKSKIRELETIIENKNKELDKKKEDLRAISAQPHRLLQIIELQTTIEKLSNVAANDSDYFKIQELQDHLNRLIDGIQDENNENTKLTFKILAQQDEIARLKKQEEKQIKAELEKIKELENELDDIRNQIKEKTKMLESSDMTITNLSTQIMELQKKLKPLEDQISDLKDTNAENAAEIQKRLELTKRQLQDSERQLNDADAKNFNLLMEIAGLRAQLKKAQKKPPKVDEKKINELEQQLQTQQRENKILESTNNDLKEELTEKSQTNAELILTITDLQNQLRNLEKEKGDEAQTTSSTIAKLRKQLKDKEEEHSRIQAEIEALQNKLNQTEVQCSNYEQKLQDLQNDLDDKMKELESKSNSVTSLALQISTLSLQIEELKNQLENTVSKSKIRELETIIENKNKELDKKKEDLRAISAQPHRLLQIIELQTTIEKLSNVAANDSDYFKIQELQDHLNRLIDGIQDENNENTKLTFKILAQQDEIARLKKQEEKQIKAELEKIKELENELDDIRNQIKEKTKMLESSDMRITNLSTQIMELHKKLKPLEDQISDLKDTNAENAAEIQKRLELTKRQLQDSERQLNDADAKNFNLLMEIAGLRAQLKKAQKKPPKVDEKKINELEQQLQTQQRENKILESTNNDLKEEVKELKTCCSDVHTQCEDFQRQLQQSQKDTDRLQQHLQEKDAELEQLRKEKDAELAQLRQEKDAELAQLQKEKDAELEQLRQELEKQARENNKLQQENSDLQRQLRQTDSNADCLLQLQDKDAIIAQFRRELENQTNECDRLQQENCDLTTQLRESHNNADCLLQLQDKDTIIAQLEQDLEKQANEHNQLQLEYSDLENEKKTLSNALEELRNRLDDVEDKTIHTRRVIFDPDTTHPRVVLSADNTEMSTAERELNVPNLPGRFDVALAALGSPGFSSGRQYWEVSVAGRLCYQIGMASESSPRKGALSFRPSTGYWTIVLNKQGSYKAIDKKVVTLRVRTHPITFGILLDYNKGQISFYDAGDRSHLYTFTGQRFSDKIYPFVLYCVEEHDNRTPITLLPPASVDWIN
ncbi:golgin subfamily A member 4 isoform X2 [Scomber scombrus]|uniref:golgin subfamily A member 4 isoform X2 n=1 Tax=Scomber scombrus TaxID=13677 RepID=UPI002DDAA0FA|nr:golgin subfamily A member 4 isoform X2 [Scomber scombrus]